MADTWTGPHDSLTDQNPYVHWWHHEMKGDPRRNLFVDVPLAPQQWFDWLNDNIQLKGEGSDLAKEEFGGGGAVPIPPHAVNKDIGNLKPLDEFPVDPPEDLPKDLVIVGIIDTGIALGHRRFRRKDGSTRFLAAWQQTSKWINQASLPCGQELYFDRINELLRDHSLPDGRLDEDAFNRAACLIEPWELAGHRDLEYRAAHGTHVLDLATGFDPGSTDDDILDKYRIIAVNLPPQYVHGTAGNFLVFFAVFALERILALADALWRKNNPNKNGGYPVVVNFSYGMQAGTKDGHGMWERLIAQMIERRRCATGAPTRLVMPVGNDNLERCAAFELMGDGEWKPGDTSYELKTEVSLPWRICPSDQTSNFVEICASALDPGNAPGSEKFQLSVTPPGLTALPVPKLKPGEYAELGDYARVYSPWSGAQYPLRLVICVAPTLRYLPNLPVAPAGEWMVKVVYEEKAPVDVAFYVQSDQSPTRHGSTDEQSYFDHPDYKTHRENGALRDSYDYKPGKPEELELEPWHEQGPVQRKGTQNALATSLGITVVGGYRLTDGSPALYSATMNGDRWRDAGREVSDGLYPTEDGAGHFGLLAAGARDGSVVGFRGTSMAAAQATRDIAEQLGQCGHGGDPDCGNSKWLVEQAKDYKSTGIRPPHYHNVPGLKGGPGHLPMPDTLAKGRLPRLGPPPVLKP